MMPQQASKDLEEQRHPAIRRVSHWLFTVASLRGLLADFTAAARFRLEHRLGTDNALQKLFYWRVLFAIAMMAPSGLAIYKPVQLGWLVWAFGGFAVARARSQVWHPKWLSGRGSEVPSAWGPSALGAPQPWGPLSLGTLTMLSGCDISVSDAVQSTLLAVSRWNDRVQAALFGEGHLAKIFPPSALAPTDRFNAYYGVDQVPRLEADSYRLSLAGAIADKRPWRVLRRVGADTTARYVGYECADGYYGGMDMPTALHPQTLIATHRRGDTLPAKYGYPFKIRIPTKLGFKNPKFVTTLSVTNRRFGGFWVDRGYNWFSGS